MTIQALTDIPLYQALARALVARQNCEKSGNTEWFAKHTATIQELCRLHLPSGSGFDNGTTINLDLSTSDKLVFVTSYHHMNGDGFYDGWTEHTVTVRPSLSSTITLAISGRDRNDVKEYIHECFTAALVAEVNPYPQTV